MADPQPGLIDPGRMIFNVCQEIRYRMIQSPDERTTLPKLVRGCGDWFLFAKNLPPANFRKTLF
jgi:hypothetical protein